MGNILLGYNAKQLGLSLHETVMGAILVQTAGDTFSILKNNITTWRGRGNVTLGEIIRDIDGIDDSILQSVFEGENEDAISYGEGYATTNTTPGGILQLAK